MLEKIKKHYSEEDLILFLCNKHNSNFLSDIKKDHIDSCKICWDLWNKVRWDKAKGTKGLLELKEYLGDSYSEYFDSSWALADEWNRKNPKTVEEIANFYKNTQNYLFNLVIWSESGDRKPFYKDLDKLIKKFDISSVIDFGCGVGTDSLFLIENKIKTYMVDYQSPSIEFLLWRLKKRKLSGKFVNVDLVNSLPKSDMFWAIDVLEHIPNPVSVVDMLHEETKVFAHHSQFNNQSGGRHPCHIINFEEQNLINALKSRGFINIPWKNLSLWVKSEFIK